jgi:hypothetical protein
MNIIVPQPVSFQRFTKNQTGRHHDSLVRKLILSNPIFSSAIFTTPVLSASIIVKIPATTTHERKCGR